jgi:hypothetical protein
MADDGSTLAPRRDDVGGEALGLAGKSAMGSLYSVDADALPPAREVRYLVQQFTSSLCVALLIARRHSRKLHEQLAASVEVQLRGTEDVLDVNLQRSFPMLSNRSISTLHIDAPSLLSDEDLAEVHGGVIRATVDGGPTTVTVDDFSLNMEIFKGNIGGPMIL